MRPEQPGPLPDPQKQQLKQQYSSRIEHGIGSLEKALQIDPQYADAMAYVNLLIRERADLADSPEQYRNEIATASGHPLRVESARSDASRWEYRPTMLNASPVEVVTQLDVNFTLP